MEHVYGLGFEVESYLDEIVSIGSRIVGIIQQNAGYARPEEKALMDVFAQYLAHFAVLAHQHGIAKEKRSAAKQPHEGSEGGHDHRKLMSVDMSAVFPIELPELINTGFLSITTDIEQWKRKALA